MDEIISLKSVITLAQQLSPVDKVRLVEQLMTSLEHDLQTALKTPKEDLYGLWADMNITISDNDIEAVRREMWQNFPREGL